jgi:hypothetical protein
MEFRAPTIVEGREVAIHDGSLGQADPLLADVAKRRLDFGSERSFALTVPITQYSVRFGYLPLLVTQRG